MTVSHLSETKHPSAENEYDELLFLLQFGKNAAFSSGRNENKAEIPSAAPLFTKPACQQEFESLCIQSPNADDFRLNFEYEVTGENSRLPHYSHMLSESRVRAEREGDANQPFEYESFYDPELLQSPYVDLLREYFGQS